MAKQIDTDIKNCWECPHVINSSQEHDCAFTSAPFPIRWYCTYNDDNRFYIENPFKIHKECHLGQFDITNSGYSR